MAKKKFNNSVYLEGYLYEHNLKERIAGPNAKTPGLHFITGEIKIATDDDCLNIVPVHFSYVPENRDGYATLKDILEGTIPSVMSKGVAEAAKLNVSTALAINDFVSPSNGNLVSAPRNEGGFIHLIQKLHATEAERNSFVEDIVITGVKEVDEDPDKNIAYHAAVKGVVFDYAKRLIPVEFAIYMPAGIDYFMGFADSKSLPVFTKIRGKQVVQQTVRRYEEESAFGGPVVREIVTPKKEYVITNAQAEPYEFGEDTLTIEELSQWSAERETMLASIKADYESRNGGNAAAPATDSATASGVIGGSDDDFKF